MRAITGSLIFLFTLASIASGQNATFTVLHSFGGAGDGVGPYSGVVFDKQGNLYGETLGGGNTSCTDGCGVVYELSPQKGGDWSETILYEFTGGDEGYEPNGGLTIDASGNLYGVTRSGGANGYGTAFELTPGGSGWTETVLYSFCTPPSCADGWYPLFAPVIDPAGNLYGTASQVLYEISPGPSGWTENVLYTFCSQPNCSDGSDPQQLIRDTAGNLYGAAESGGNGGPDGAGVVFSLRSEPGGGWTYIKLHDFDGNALGDGPDAVSLHDGALYGNTLGCGVSSCGTIFDLTVSDHRVKPGRLYVFTNPADGATPLGNLAFDSAGNLYGATAGGGAICGCGVVFEMAPESAGTWQYQLLHDFDDEDGVLPQYGVIYHDGHLFGTTLGGGQYGVGVVFEITP